jgi:hypothetical protein
MCRFDRLLVVSQPVGDVQLMGDISTGPFLPPSCGYQYAVVDRTTRWPKAFPLASITPADCAKAFFPGWVARFGVPAVITSDRGTQLTSSL